MDFHKDNRHRKETIVKRDILCPSCAAEYRKTHGIPENSQKTHSPYPREYVKFIHGKAVVDMMFNATGDACFRCDSCYAAIRPGDACVAYSCWTDRFPYFPWETAYIEPDTK